uniref:Eukaryotic translation initiation factor 3 subunit E n=1 Tax=Parastrongyloides trichosuri TaxID=131310 RepID=A0A0N4ZU67_PARTI
MADFDLTHRMTPFFDVHLVIPLLEFIEARKIYSKDSLVEVQRNVLIKTNMIDSLIETYSKDKVPDDLIKRKDEILAQRNKLKEEAEEILTILEKPEVKELIENKSERESGAKLTELLSTKHGFKPEMLDTLFKYAKFLYECGNYNISANMLMYYRTLVSPSDKNYLNALYGKLASEILLQEWIHAKNDLMRIRLFIESNPFNNEIELIKHRAWVMHWALFVCFNNPEGRDEIIEMFLNLQQYANAIQIVSPHLLRYLAVAIVTSKHKQTNSLKELVKLLESYGEHYKDPITEFLTCLYIKYDFNEAQKYLKQCQSVLANDFFLTAYADEFNEACRLLVFESFCRIHNCVKLDMLAERLNMDTEEAEKWIVDLIRKYKIEGAKIDSQNREVVMTPNVQSLHEQVMESTKRIYTRIHSMVLNLEKIQIEREVQENEVY